MTQPDNQSIIQQIAQFIKNLGQRDVQELHRHADTDSNYFAVHHTLGSLPYQSSPGSHTHDGRNSKVLAPVSVAPHSHDAASVTNLPGSGLTASNVEDSLHELQGEILSHTHDSSIYVQDTAPVGSLPSKYLWVQTNMGTSGEGITFWVEDGD